jgi:hypothetical protein
VRLLIAFQAKTQAYSMVLDVKGAFLKSYVDQSKNEKLFLKLPDGRIVRLKKYICGLKQAGREWQDNVTGTLLDNGYEQSEDPLVFVNWSGDDFFMMSLHIDDFYLISSQQYMLDELYTTLEQTYGEITKKSDDILTYLGMAISKNSDGTITISQPAYIEKMVVLAEMTNTNPVDTPLPVKISDTSATDTPVDKTTYLRLVGLINYLMYTRTDIYYALSRVAQRCSNPTNADLQRVKRIIRYVYTTKHYGITFNCDNDFRIYAYVDASFDCYSDSTSHYGFLLTIGRSNGPYVCKSAKLKMVCMSSTEAEYVALANVCREIVYQRKLLNSLGFPQT